MKLVLVLVFSAFFSIQAFAETYRVRWLMAHEPSNTRLLEAAREFGANLEKDSGGRFKFELIPMDEKSPIPMTLARNDVYTGDMEMSQVSVSSLEEYVPQMNALSLPMAFKNHRHVEQALDGKVGKELRDALFTATDGRIRALAFTYSGGFRNILSRKSLAELSSFRGAKSVLVTGRLENSLFNGLGVDFMRCENCWMKGVLRPMLESGEVEINSGHTNRLAVLLQGMPDSVKKQFTITETNHSVFLTAVIVNEAFLQKLPKDLRALFEKSVVKAANAERKLSIQQAEQNRDFLIQQGVKFEAPSRALMKRIGEVALAIRARQASETSLLARKIDAVQPDGRARAQKN